MTIFYDIPPLKLAHNERAFTLVELMIALFISSLVIAVITSVYIAQSRNFSELDDLSSIQQGVRGALIILPLEMRLAGCDPTESSVPGIIAANRTSFQFTLDNSGDPINANTGDGDVDDPGENITFGFSPGVDTDNNGIVNTAGVDWNGTASLTRRTGAGVYQPLANNIEALEFNYLLDDGSTTLTPAILNRIRSVQVSILARATQPAPNFLHAGNYTTASGAVWTPPNDNFRRRLVVTNIQLRNMGY